MRTRALTVSLVVAALALIPGIADAQSCGRVAVLALPSVTWADIETFEPPNLLRAIEEGSAASVSVRTNTARTSYASGFATLGGGARLDGGRTTVGAFIPQGEPGYSDNLPISGMHEMNALAEEAGYGAVPGALAEALDTPVGAVGNSDLGLPPASPFGFGRWSMLAATSADGKVDLAATGTPILMPDDEAPFGVRTDPAAMQEAVDTGYAEPCTVLFIDPGDLIRADVVAEIADERDDDAFEEALMAADEIAGLILDNFINEEDLLLIVSPTSPRSGSEPHLGVAIAWGEGFPAGSSLESASTRRTGIVTLPDVAPTIVEFFGEKLPSSMNGRRWVAVDAAGDRIEAGVELDERSVFVDGLRSGISAGFVVAQFLLYVAAVLLLRGDPPPGRVRRALRVGALAVAAFPGATFVAGLFPAFELGIAAFVAVPVLLAVFGALSAERFARDALDALLWVAGTTVAVIAIDLIFGGWLQMNTVFGYSPIVAGRFDGLGNIAFAVLGASTIITGTLLVHRRPNSRGMLAAVIALFVAVVIIDGAPHLGGDVGGVLTLVPALAITFLLLTDRRPRPWQIAVVVLGALAALAVFVGIDVSRPESQQTHLARTFQDIKEDGLDPLFEVIGRKARANLRVFTSTIWTYFVPPALATLAYLLFRPRGRWRKLREDYPRVRAGLIGGLLLAGLGFALNDSGIVIPAMTLSYVVPMTLLLQVSIAAPEPEPT